mmetsp:Transcript_20383/g.28315  ORF Transcript_20383/g.28315 Transcript_20383/m.28315 type:complete len:405 (-) Transcript_20383:698-1912(-)
MGTSAITTTVVTLENDLEQTVEAEIRHKSKLLGSCSLKPREKIRCSVNKNNEESDDIGYWRKRRKESSLLSDDDNGDLKERYPSAVIWVARVTKNQGELMSRCSVLLKEDDVKLMVSDVIARHRAARSLFLEVVRGVRVPLDVHCRKLGKRWLESSGASELRRKAHSLGISYDDYVGQPKEFIADTIIQIDRDLVRTKSTTFKGDAARKFLSHMDTEEVTSKMRRVLAAFCQRNSHIGYTQGLNYLCFILLAVLPEAEAFWTMNAMLKCRIRDFYSRRPGSLNGLRIDSVALVDMVELQWPGLGDTKDGNGFSLRQVVGDVLGSTWLVLMFVTQLNLQSTLIVLDCVFAGERSSLYVVASSDNGNNGSSSSSSSSGRKGGGGGRRGSQVLGATRERCCERPVLL